MLEAQGRISREVGRGTFLRDTPRTAADAPAADSLAGPVRPRALAGPVPAAGQAPGADFAPADVMTVRRLLEPPAMSLVVAWATAADLEEMDRCLAGGDQAASYEEFESWDLALHRCIMAASHSPLLAALYQAIEAARHGQVWGDLKRRSASPEHREQYQGDHRAIVGALHARDSAQRGRGDAAAPGPGVGSPQRHRPRRGGHLALRCRITSTPPTPPQGASGAEVTGER